MFELCRGEKEAAVDRERTISKEQEANASCKSDGPVEGRSGEGRHLVESKYQVLRMMNPSDAFTAEGENRRPSSMLHIGHCTWSSTTPDCPDFGGITMVS